MTKPQVFFALCGVASAFFIIYGYYKYVNYTYNPSHVSRKELPQDLGNVSSVKHRFDNGHIQVANSSFPPNPARMTGLSDAQLPVKAISMTQDSVQLKKIRRTDLWTLTEAQLESLYFTIVEQQHITCPKSRRLGESGDGGWDICFADLLDLRKSKPCVAFSFGINYVWTFEDQLADTYQCVVNMYDASMTSVSDHQRKKTSWFHRIGLSFENKVETNGWKMRTLCRLFEVAGFAGKPVDVLKIDIEYWEWVSFEKAFAEGCLRQVRQLLFETHTGVPGVVQKTNFARLIRAWLGLFDLGFRTWKWHKNPSSTFFKSGSTGVQRACCYEHYMINTSML